MMVLVDSSVWIDHLHREDDRLVELLEAGEVRTHPCVLGELACGSINRRERFLTQLFRLPRLPEARFEQVMALIEKRRLWGKGLTWVDAQVLASALLSGAWLWTRDKRLHQAAVKCGVGF
jgi:predicted nucleic acid-binding protein